MGLSAKHIGITIGLLTLAIGAYAVKRETQYINNNVWYLKATGDGSAPPALADVTAVLSGIPTTAPAAATWSVTLDPAAAPNGIIVRWAFANAGTEVRATKSEYSLAVSYNDTLNAAKAQITRMTGQPSYTFPTEHIAKYSTSPATNINWGMTSAFMKTFPDAAFSGVTGLSRPSLVAVVRFAWRSLFFELSFSALF
eukprot:GHVS01004335.1.p1 GENE.GHVS01004335.1~~GHVS01004335.1.p1  ORF type:complete len:197 (+),score=19.75 GHVS01004335.1:133-723(+)